MTNSKNKFLIKKIIGAFIIASGLTIFYTLFFYDNNSAKDIIIDQPIPKKLKQLEGIEVDTVDWEDNHQENSKAVDALESVNLAQQMSESNVDYETEAVVIEKQTGSLDDLEQPLAPKNALPKGWVIQVGSFKTTARAEKLVAQLDDILFPVLIENAIVNNVTVYRVFVGPFFSSKQTQTEKQRLEQVLGYSPVIYNYKNN